jgi:hypothetical protein
MYCTRYDLNYEIMANIRVQLEPIEIVPVQAMKAGRGNRGVAPPILNLGVRWRCVVNIMPRPLYPREITPVPTEQKAERAPELVETFWRREKSLAPTEFRTPDRQARSRITILTELTRLQSLTNELATPNYMILGPTLNFFPPKRFQYYSLSATHSSKIPVKTRS